MSAPLLSSQFGVCVGYNQSCEGGSWVDDYSLVPGYENPESSCDGLDNDCDGLVDEGTGGSCYGSPGLVCGGLLNCSARFALIGDCASGCSLLPGVCNNSGKACDLVHPCDGGGTCVGDGCGGFVSCEGFNASTCSSVGFGCSLKDCGSAFGASKSGPVGGLTCDGTSDGCQWNCSGAVTVEICSNGIDDDGDKLVDCEDDDCNGGGALSVADADVARFNCLGTNQTGDKTGNAYYCGVGDTDPTVGLCCPAGQRPKHDDVFGLWYCQDYAPCMPSPPYTCDYDYSSEFANWVHDNGCLDVSANLACCKVVQFGNDEYYSDAGNVVVY